jgi:hypothetical protein
MGAAGASIVTVRPGGSLPVVVSGFAPGASVTLRVAGASGGDLRRADHHGVLRATYRAPRLVGDYRLLVSGAPAPSPAVRRDSRGTPGQGHQNVVVAVPRIAVIGIRVVAARRNEGAREAGAGGLSTTGTDITGLLIWAGCGLVTGTTLLVLATGRPSSARR